ncbi:response regulator [Mesorhizobium sp. B2-4-13]|uniref:response regulator n=1 Tax=Mesorhizobium sp. B2-4-13 TaxID=2589936 RepID=UPI001FED7D42|nr:response regulator [Mesorhizobium sp. B2-4-13]
MMHDGKVLVVEDEPVILLDLDFALTKAGFTVVAASNAASAIEAFDVDPSRIRALVADIRLGPGMRGWDVARHIRQANPNLPVVYATGDTASHWGAEGVSKHHHLETVFHATDCHGIIDAD